TPRNTGGCATSSAPTAPAPRLAPQPARERGRATSGTPTNEKTAQPLRSLGPLLGPLVASAERPSLRCTGLLAPWPDHAARAPAAPGGIHRRSVERPDHRASACRRSCHAFAPSAEMSAEPPLVRARGFTTRSNSSSLTPLARAACLRVRLWLMA